MIAGGETKDVALARATAAFAAAGEAARANRVTYCIEPLSRDQTPLINTVAEAATIVQAVNTPHLSTMIDTSSAGLAETESIPELISRWLPTGEGLFAFETMDDVLSGIEAMNADYARHARAARAIAEEHFDSAKVLPNLLAQIGAGA